MSLRLPRAWKLWKPGRRRKRYAALGFHARELLLAPLRLRPDWPLRQLAPIEGTPPATRTKLVAFVGCDPRYLDEHVPDLLRSIERSSPDTAVHLHVYHPAAPDHAAVASLRRQLRLPLSATWEACRLDGLSPRQRATYYESMRFVRLSELLETVATPIASIDADSHVRAPLERLLEATDGADVGLVLRTERADPGMNVLAAAVLARPTEAARLYFRDVARRIARHWISKPGAGYLDQRAMWFAYRKLRRRVRFAVIPSSFSDDSMLEHSDVWHAKGERVRDERFALARASLREG